MKSQETKPIEENLKTIPDGKLSVEQHQQDGIPLSKQFHAVTVGKGRIEAYSVFRGVDPMMRLCSLSVQKWRSAIFRMIWIPRSSFMTADITRSAGRTATETAARSGKTSLPLTIRRLGVQNHDASGLLRSVVQPV